MLRRTSAVGLEVAAREHALAVRPARHQLRGHETGLEHQARPALRENGFNTWTAASSKEQLQQH